ncbi:hypothetical protein [Micromonospora sp. NPDC049891]|uniref:DUF7167 family protein n=1 Tax=Micromonospora sp. NPDC049891 TaxID=3155655 RepID=UPI0033DDFE08
MTRRDPVIIELNCEAHPSTDTVEYDRDQWNKMTPAERASALDEMVDEHISNAGGGGWHIEDPDDYNTVGSTPTKVELPLADHPAVVAAVEAWLSNPQRPSGPVYASARDLLARIDAAITGKQA